VRAAVSSNRRCQKPRPGTDDELVSGSARWQRGDWVSARPVCADGMEVGTSGNKMESPVSYYPTDATSSVYINGLNMPQQDSNCRHPGYMTVLRVHAADAGPQLINVAAAAARVYRNYRLLIGQYEWKRRRPQFDGFMPIQRRPIA